MKKNLEKYKKDISKNAFYRDALIYHLIHKGYKKEIAILKVKRMIQKRQGI